jgi:hypothetical protein
MNYYLFTYFFLPKIKGVNVIGLVKAVVIAPISFGSWEDYRSVLVIFS